MLDSNPLTAMIVARAKELSLAITSSPSLVPSLRVTFSTFVQHCSPFCSLLKNFIPCTLATAVQYLKR